MNIGFSRKDYRPAYEEFFQQNELVFSLPYSFAFWNVWIRHGVDFLHARSSIPYRLYVGITFLNKSGIEFGTITERNPKTNEFATADFLLSSLAASAEAILEYVAKINLDRGIRISFFSEVSRGICFAFSGHFSQWLAMAIALAGVKWAYNDALRTIIADQSVRDSIIASSTEIWWLFKTKPATGLFYQTLLPSISPRVFKSKSTDVVTDPTEHGSFGKFGTKYAIVFSGLQSNSWLVEKAISTDLPNLDKFTELNALKLNEYLTALSSLVVQGENLSNTEQFYHALKKYVALLHAQIEESQFEEDFKVAFLSAKHHMSDRAVALPLYHSRYGGSYIAYYSGPSADDSFATVIASLQKSYPSLRVEFRSSDTIQEKLSPRIDQAAWEDVISEFSQKGNFVIQEKLDGSKNIVKYDDDAPHVDGLLLDTLNKRIYVNGERISSKDIPTQQTAIELLSLFFGDKKEISIAELTKSSYSTNKSDMSSKVLIPLRKLTKSVFGEELDISCRWAINDFYITLNPPQSFEISRLLRKNRF